ncbi:MAG: serine/threonine protein kinase [Planctomycetota bacterium]
MGATPQEAPSGAGLPLFQVEEVLKTDLFGRIERGRLQLPGAPLRAAVRRDAGAGPFWARLLARRLARREARALEALGGAAGFPRLLFSGRGVFFRSWLAGRPMQEALPRDPVYFHQALRLVVRMHRLGVVHNDLAKEPNWLVTPRGGAALVDFQLAWTSRRRGRWFRLQAREDLRHLLKHKRTYCPARLTARERRLLERPSLPARVWRLAGKPLYLGVTRGLLGWADREGAGDRSAGPGRSGST